MVARYLAIALANETGLQPGVQNPPEPQHEFDCLTPRRARALNGFMALGGMWMGWSTTPTSEPHRKIYSFRKKCDRLRGAIKANESPHHIHAAAEKVRIAKIGLIKAHLSLIYEYPRRDPQGRQMLKLCEQAIVWLSKPTEEIVREIGVEPGLPKTRGTLH